MKGNMHLNAARLLMQRVPFPELIRKLTGQDETEGPWLDEIEFWADQLARSEITDVSPERVTSDARNFRELESLVRALDSLETIASMADVAPE